MRFQAYLDAMRKIAGDSLLAVTAVALLILCAPAFSQVSPAEITNPHLKAAQSAYFQSISALYKQINETKFPFPFVLSRTAGLDPSRQANADGRGIEFVYFNGRMLLKVSGSYEAAFRADSLTQNQRAARTFVEVAEPVLILASKTIPNEIDCDGIGFEISFHVRTRTKSLDFEGKEILTVIFDPVDFSAFAGSSSDSERQEILNRSEVYLDGQRFGLALGAKDPLDVDALDEVFPSPDARVASTRTSRASVYRPASQPVYRALFSNQARLSDRAGLPAGQAPGILPAAANTFVSEPQVAPTSAPEAAPTTADADALQSQFQSQLDTLAKSGMERFHFVDYAPPAFIVYRNQVMLQLTLRNTIHFSADSTSIYKRAAQTFDLFLAGQLKDLLEKIPDDAKFAGFDITVLNQVGSDARSSSEAVEFICPRAALREFVDAGVTNQQLIDQSIVLVNGVRIALNLQLVE